MNFLLPFFDDSTLIFASTMRKHLENRLHKVFLHYIDDGSEALSSRQLESYLNDHQYSRSSSLFVASQYNCADAIITAKARAEDRENLNRSSYRHNHIRPCYISFLTGLEFTPRKGFRARKNFDAIFLTNRNHINSFKHMYPQNKKYFQHISFGHPYFLQPKNFRNFKNDGDIVFFPQAICPPSFNGRMHMARVLNTMANVYNGRRVFIKLRHLPSENAVHIHKEKFPYPYLFENFIKTPAKNISFTTASISEIFNKIGYSITCTSTAAMDSIAAGVPTAVYCDYVEFYKDKYTSAMRSEFMESNIIRSIDDVLSLNFGYPNPEWMADRFRSEDLFEEIEWVVHQFQLKRGQ